MTAGTRATIGTVFRLVLAGVLGWAGVAKLTEPGGARDAIVAYRVFSAQMASFLGWALPAFEIGLAVLLVLGLFTRWAALASGLLFVAFVVGISSVWIRGYSIDCGCFGGGGDIDPSGKTWRYASEIGRDVIFAGMSAWLVAWPHTRWSLDRQSSYAADTGIHQHGDLLDPIDPETT